MRYFFLTYLFLIVLVVSVAGFRGHKSPLTPIEIFNDMDHQAKLKPQSESAFFATGRGAQEPVAGTVPMGFEVPEKSVADGAKPSLDGFGLGSGYLSTGRMGEYYGHGMPEEITVDETFLKHGQKQFAIYCAICHGASGNGGGVISKYGLAVANLTISPVTDPAQRPDGSLYDTIVHGKGLMGSYGANLNLRDRWAIVAYVRALQNRNKMPAADVQEAFSAWEAAKASEATTAEPSTTEAP